MNLSNIIRGLYIMANNVGLNRTAKSVTGHSCVKTHCTGNFYPESNSTPMVVIHKPKITSPSVYVSDCCLLPGCPSSLSGCLSPGLADLSRELRQASRMRLWMIQQRCQPHSSYNLSLWTSTRPIVICCTVTYREK